MKKKVFTFYYCAQRGGCVLNIVQDVTHYSSKIMHMGNDGGVVGIVEFTSALL